jgi:hypothetical protein
MIDATRNGLTDLTPLSLRIGPGATSRDQTLRGRAVAVEKPASVVAGKKAKE